MTISLPWLTSLFYISIRLGAVLLFTPIQAIRQLPIHARLLFIFTLSLLLNNYIQTQTDVSTIGLGALAEFFNGIILSTAIYATFSLFQIAGQIIDNQIGLNATIFDPNEHNHEPLSSRLLSIFAVLFFFSLDGHLWLFKGLVYSFELNPPGTPALFAGFKPIMRQFGFMFSMGFLIASPIILALLTIDLCSGFLTRNMPQMSAYFLALPVKITLGLLMLSMQLSYFTPMANKVFSECFHTWQEILS